MIVPSARLAALVLSVVPLGCIRVPRGVATEFCAQSPKHSNFSAGESTAKPSCCLPAPIRVAKSGSAVQGERCAR
ncbi:MAG TPA: hypothetical protein VFZ53_22465 [Polyangiaceae bacterium]